MKKQQAKKSKMRSLKKNKVAVSVIVTLAVFGLVFSSILAAFGQNFIGNNNTANNTNLISQMERQISQYEANLKTAPDNVFLLTQLGNAYYQLGVLYSGDATTEQKSIQSFAKALEPYQKVLAQTPNDVNVRVDRAVAAFYSNNYQEASNDFKKAIELEPEHAKAHFNYGMFLYYGLGNKTEAIKHWEKVIALNPANEKDLISQANAMIAIAKSNNTNNNGGFLPEKPNTAE